MCLNWYKNTFLAKISSPLCPPWKPLPVGKAVLHGCIAVALSLEHFFATRERAFTACAGPVSLFRNSFPYSRLEVQVFVLCRHLLPGQRPAMSVPREQGGNGILHLQHRQCAQIISQHRLRVRPAGFGGQTLTVEVDLSLPLLFVSKVLFHPNVSCLSYPDTCKPCSH